MENYLLWTNQILNDSTKQVYLTTLNLDTGSLKVGNEASFFFCYILSKCFTSVNGRKPHKQKPKQLSI